MRVPGSSPPADSIVVREGKRKPAERVIREAENDRLHREEEGTWDGNHHLSVFAGPVEEGESLGAAAARLFGANRRAKHFRTATPADLAAAGFNLVATPPEPYHYDSEIGPAVNVSVIEAFDDCFGEEIRNPTWS